MLLWSLIIPFVLGAWTEVFLPTPTSQALCICKRSICFLSRVVFKLMLLVYFISLWSQGEWFNLGSFLSLKWMCTLLEYAFLQQWGRRTVNSPILQKLPPVATTIIHPMNPPNETVAGPLDSKLAGTMRRRRPGGQWRVSGCCVPATEWPGGAC